MTGIAAPVDRGPVPAGTAIGVFSIATLVFTWAFESFLQLQASSDLTVHIDYARTLHSLADVTSPHFLFELLIVVGYNIGFSWGGAAAWLLGACYGGMAALIAREFHRRGIDASPLATFALVMAVLLASHIFLLTLSPAHLYNGYFVPTAYHNPTQQLNKLFALWIYVVYRWNFLGSRPATVSSALVLAALCILSALAKPSFLIAFLPAAALYAMYDLWRRQWRQALLCLAGIGIPSALTMVWQMGMTDAGQGLDVSFRPFAVFSASETLYKLPASLAFPLIVAAGALWTRTTDAGLRFIWVFTGIALAVTLGLAEGGHRVDHGNFAWTGQTAVFLMYVESLLFMLTQTKHAWTRAAWALFAVHVVCGLFWYGLVFRTDWEFWL